MTTLSPEVASPAASVCRVCGTEASELVFTGSEDRFGLGGAFDVVRCRGCGFTWTDIDTDFDLQDWYDRGYWQDDTLETARRPGSAASPLRSIWRALNGSPRPSRWVTSGRVLDLGCGPGYDSLEMQQAGADVIGVDTSTSALFEAHRSGLPSVSATALQLPFADGSFDAVVLSQVMEHVQEPAATLLELRRVLKHGGRLVILSPNRRSIQSSIFGNGWVNWHLPYHLWHFDARSISSLLEDAGFRVDTVDSFSPGEWFLLSAARRSQRLGKDLPVWQSRALRLLAIPFLHAANLFGRGDCLHVDAYRS